MGITTEEGLYCVATGHLATPISPFPFQTPTAPAPFHSNPQAFTHPSPDHLPLFLSRSSQNPPLIKSICLLLELSIYFSSFVSNTTSLSIPCPDESLKLFQVTELSQRKLLSCSDGCHSNGRWPTAPGALRAPETLLFVLVGSHPHFLE